MWDVTKFFPFHINKPLDIAIVSGLGMQPFLGKTISQRTSWYSGSNNLFALSFSIFPEPEMQEEYRCSHWGWVPHNLLLSMFSSGMVFCDGLHLLEEGLL